MSFAEIVTSLTIAAGLSGASDEGWAAGGSGLGVAVAAGVGLATGARGVVPRRGDCAAAKPRAAIVISTVTKTLFRFMKVSLCWERGRPVRIATLKLNLN